MKRFFSYIMVLMFLLPTVGLHIDLSSCCKTEMKDTSHSLEVNVSHCCAPIEHHNNCLSNEEICIAPSEQTFTAESEFSLLPLATITLPYIQIKGITLLLDNPIQAKSIDDIGSKETTPSFLQVFLC